MPIISPFSPVCIPDVDLWSFIFDRDDRLFQDSKVIFTDPLGGRSYSYGDIRRSSIRFGQGLKKIPGWRKGDVMVLCALNSIEIPIVIWGCLWAGGIVCLVNPGFTTNELAQRIGNIPVKTIVTERDVLPKVQATQKHLGIEEVRTITLDDHERDRASHGDLHQESDSSSRSDGEKEVISPAHDLAFLVFSSGTTGLPKGVMLSHKNVVANVLLLAAGEEGHLTWNSGPDGSGDRTLAFLPFFHIYGDPCPTHTKSSRTHDVLGLACEVLQALYQGFTAVVMRTFTFESFLALVERHKITAVYLVPPVLLRLAKDPMVDKYNLSSLRMLSSGAAPLTKDLTRAVYQRLRIPTKQGYGISELTATVYAQRWSEWDSPIASVGKLLPNQLAKVVSCNGTEVEEGATGELLVKGPNVFHGYLNNPEETQRALTPDGFFKTGDVGFQDEEGNFFITDRSKEMINYKGFQIAPAELEGVISSNPNIDDVAVVGLYQEHMVTEVPVAYVVPRSGRATEGLEEEVQEWVAKRVADYMRLRGGVRITECIPKSVSGKILRKELKPLLK